MDNEVFIVKSTTDSITLSNSLCAELERNPHVYPDVAMLEGTEKVGSKQCVALVKEYLKAPPTTQWVEGEVVFGNDSIKKGTAIATFVNEKYESKSSGNHAAIYISQDSTGIIIMDQWKDDLKKPKVSSRKLTKKGKKIDGSYVNPSNNADAYSIILW